MIATHKKYWVPQDVTYMPIHVGKYNKEGIGFQGDDTGDNISSKNSNYCELTALYWAWKNLKCEYIGLCHYRRYFAHPCFFNTYEGKKKSIYMYADYLKVLKRYDVIVPWRFNLKVQTIKDQYAKDHYLKDLEETRSILATMYPDYLDSFDTLMLSRKLFLCNMFVTKKCIFDQYAQWIFSIFFELEKRIDISGYDDYQKRVYGFLSERLFNVWLHKNDCLRLKQVPVVFLEKEANDENTLKRLLKYLWFYIYEKF